MGDYVRITRAHLTGTTIAVWSFLLACLVLITTVDGESASFRSMALPQNGFLNGVLSRKSYMAMFAYFNACLWGVLLRDTLAQPWATVVPRYRQKHLVVALVNAILFLAIPMLLLGFVGNRNVALTSIFVIFLTCLSAGLWTLHHPILGLLALPFLAFTFASSSASPRFTAFLAGQTPLASLGLSLLSLLALGAFAWRMLQFREETLEYVIARVWGDLLRGRSGPVFQGQARAFADSLEPPPRDPQNGVPAPGELSNLNLLDRLSPGRPLTFWQRLQLWRLGIAPARTSGSTAWLVLITLVIIPVMLAMTGWGGAGLSARNTVLLFAAQVMTNPVTLWPFWLQYRQRLSPQLLRPLTRRSFLREHGLVLAGDLAQCWIGGVSYAVVAGALWAPELLDTGNLLVFLTGTAAGQVWVFVTMSLWLRTPGTRGVAANIAYACSPFVAMTAWTETVVMNGGINLNLRLAVIAILTVTGVAAITLVDRLWRQADLD